MALAGRRPAAARRGAAYLARTLDATWGLGDLARSAVALVAVDGARARRLGARICRELKDRQRADGSFARDANATALAILALSAEGRPRASARAAGWLAAQRGVDGGFGYRAGVASDVDTTGFVTWALASLPGRRNEARQSLAYLRAAQGEDGGFGSAPGSSSNSQSTGLALAGLRALGVRPAHVRTEDRIDPVDYLTTLQRRSGAIAYSQRACQTPIWTTSQALLGLGRRRPRPPDAGRRSMTLIPDSK
jgi:hypothetical protein